MNESSVHRFLTVKPWVLFVFALLIGFTPPHPIAARVWISLWVAAFTWWTLQMGRALAARMPRPEILNQQTFRYLVGFAALYLLGVFWVTEGGYSIDSNNAAEYGWRLWIIIPLHFFVMYCMFFGMYFLSKAMVSIRQAQGHRDESTVLYMLGFWFFPIGIWVIQPRIIEILRAKSVTGPGGHSA